MKSSQQQSLAVATLAILTSASAALASEPIGDGSAPLRAMSLQEAIAYGRAHQPAVLVGIARVGAAKEASNIPRAQWQPFVGLNAQVIGATANNTTATYLSPDYVDVARIGATRAVSSGSWQPYASTFVGAGAHQEVFEFGRIAAEAAVADELAEVQRYASRNALLDVTYGVEEAYFAVEAAKSVFTAAEDAYKRAKVHRDLAHAGVASGMRPPIELTRAEADLARFDAGRIRARGGLSTSRVLLAAAVGAPDAALDTAGAPGNPSDLPALNDAIAQAGARDPRILQALEQLRAEEARTRAIDARMRPDVSLTAAITGRAGGAPPSSGAASNTLGWLPDVPNWDLGLVLSWPIFDPTVRAAKKAAVAQEQVRHEELAQLRFDAVASIRRAYVSVQVARDALPALQQALSASKDNWAQADARFRAGLGTAVELADAEAVLAEAEINLALGVFDIARTRALFGRTIAEGL